MEANNSLDSVGQWLKNRTIFMTGGTGFIGRNLIMKLLKGVNSVKCIYVLVRKRDGCRPEERIRNVLASEGIADERIQVVEGNLKEENFGLDKSTLDKLNAEVEIVFHVAATINFKAPLDYSVDVNVRGTEKLLLMAGNFHRLQVFVHVSTAFCQCQVTDTVREKVYEAPLSANKVLAMEDQALVKNEKQLLGKDWPNTYCWTKSVAEDLVADDKWKFPRVILRPSIVTPAIREPYYSWSVEKTLVTGMVIVWNLGIFHVLNLGMDGLTNIIPVDVVSNACILSAYQQSSTKKKDVLVINCTNPCKKPIYYKDLFLKTKVKNTQNYFYYLIQNILFELIPLSIFFFLDPRLKDVYYFNRKLEKTLQYFVERNWYFEYSNMKKLMDSVNKEDQIIYSIEYEDVDWFELSRQSGDRIFQDRIKKDPKLKTLLQAYQVWIHFIYLIYLLIIYQIFQYMISFIWN